MCYRFAGPADGPALVLLHWSPSHSSQYEPVMPYFAERGWRVIAPDTWGYGESAKPEGDPPMADYARVLGHVLDGIGVERACLAGGHTGASIAVEFALQQPARVLGLVLDGCPLYTPEEQAHLLATYAPPIVLQEDGSHLLWAWNHMAQMGNARRTPEQIMSGTMSLLMAGESYHKGYNAAFSYDLAGALPRLTQPVLFIASGGDVLAGKTEAAARLVPGAEYRPFAPAGTPPGDRWHEFARITDGFLRPLASHRPHTPLKDSYLA